jgi:uracil-DNA glycosylase
MFLQNKNKSAVLNILHEELNIDPILLENVYAYFQNPSVILEEKYKLVKIEDLNSELYNNAINKCSYGIDLPVWFSSSGQNRKKIFLLAMDPMRGYDDRTTADLNSPFSIHLGANNNYFSAIKELSETFDIYITDVFKLFYREKENKKKVSNASPDFTKLSIHYRLINKEINQFEPDLIFCLGKKPLAGLSKLGGLEPNPLSTTGKLVQYSFKTDNRVIPTFAIPHASGVAARWAQAFLRNNDWGRIYNPKTYISDAMEIIIKKMNSI